MNRRFNFAWIFISIVFIVAIPLIYSNFYENLSQLVVKKAYVSAYVVGVSPSYVSGMVTKMYVKSGDVVKRGQMLALIDDTLYRAEVEKKQSVLKSLLFELKQVDNQTEPFRYRTLENEAEVAKKDVELSQLMLSYTRVVSPIEGVVARDMVHAGDSVTPSTVLVYIYRPSTLYVRAFVTPRQLKYLRLKQVVTVYDVLNRKYYTGEIYKIGGLELFSVCNTKPLIPVDVKVKKPNFLNFGEPVYLIISR